jgi:hypothetical protein
MSDSALNPWKFLSVHPYLGEQRVVISWQAPDTYADSKYFVARSPSGTPGSWKVLNGTSPVANGVDHFADEELGRSVSLGDPVFYRVKMERPDGSTMLSPTVELFNELPRHDYGLVAAHMEQEWLSMLHGGGVPCWHCIPKTSGENSSNHDPATGVVVGAPCSNDYGQTFKGGFLPPVETRIRAVVAGPLTVGLHPEMLGTTRTYSNRFRAMAFPRPRTGHMFVLPGDQRYAVGNVVEPFLFRNLVPLAWEFNAELLDPSDPRYRLPVGTLTSTHDRRIDFRL